jgi:hypothetical protein
MCSNPVDKLAKQLQESMMHGLKVGRDCQLGQGGGVQDEEGPPRVESVNTETGDIVVSGATNDEETLAALESASEQLQNEAMEALKELEEAEAKLENAEQAFEEEAIGQAQLDQAQQVVDEAREKFDAKRDAMEVVDSAIQRQKENMANKKGRGCPPDTPDCGSNDCTAMSEWAKQTMQCTMEFLQGQPTESPFGPGQPGDVDPSPIDDPLSPAWSECLSAIGAGAPPAAKQCWAYDCGPRAVTIAATSEECGCGNPEEVGGLAKEAGMNGTCGALDCPDGIPVFAGGRCTCSPGGTGPGGGSGPPEPPPFSLGEPLTVDQVWSLREATLTFGPLERSGPPSGVELGSPDWPPNR